MQVHDIAAKVLIDICRDEIPCRFLNNHASQSTLIENLPQETFRVKRTDFPMQVTDTNGNQTLVVLEIQTRWHRHVPLNLLDDRVRHIPTSMIILSGLVSDQLPLEILSRRRDLMIESAAYDLIKQEGIQQGIQEGKLSASKDVLIELLTERFDAVPEDLIQTIDRIDNLFTLKALRKTAMKALSLESFRNDLEMMIP